MVELVGLQEERTKSSLVCYNQYVFLLYVLLYVCLLYAVMNGKHGKREVERKVLADIGIKEAG